MRWRMDKKRANARCCHMVRYICRVPCTVNSMHVICIGACSPSCIRSVHVRSMHVAAMPLWLLGCSTLSENHVPTPLFILHWLNTFCCSRQLGTFLFLLGSQSSRLQAAEIYRGRHLLRMDNISRLTMLNFFRGRGS